MNSDAVAISAGYQHSMILKQDGSVWATGDNRYGQLGDGTTVHKQSFVKVVPSGQCDNTRADLRDRPTIISWPISVEAQAG